MTKLIPIGNSKGIRIPKALIEQAGLEDKPLELKLVEGGLLIQPFKAPRQGWQDAIDAALAQGTPDTDAAWLDADLDGELGKI